MEKKLWNVGRKWWRWRKKMSFKNYSS